ncbi:MAG: DUF2110 family protein [Candidatus Bathyarchaeota archaeon]|nr:DUF2110 family protein [Candidatus Bathyarchaeota archaeon]
MTRVTLLTKLYSSNQRCLIDETLQVLFEGLDVKVAVEVDKNSFWVTVSLTGEDEAIAKNILARDIGFCPSIIENIMPSSTLKGFVTDLKNSSKDLLVDVGVYQPKPVLANVPLENLQAKLAEANRFALDEIADLWGICENLPLKIKVVNVDILNRRIKAELATEQIEKYLFWRDSLLDRLLVFGASLSQIKLAVTQALLNRDIIDIEYLGMFEHALVCKLGTDAAGLIPRLGRRIRAATFTVFNPRKIYAFFNSCLT